MKNIFKYLLKHKIAVLGIVLLLIVQAYCDLSLPTYTSDIVDVGLEQYGIDDNVMTTMRGNTLKKLSILMSAEDEKTFRAAYELGDDGNYHLKDIEKEDRAALSDILSMPMVTLYSMENSDAMAGMTGTTEAAEGTDESKSSTDAASVQTGSGMASAQGASMDTDTLTAMGFDLQALMSSGIDMSAMADLDFDDILSLIDKGIIDKETFRSYVQSQEDSMLDTYGSISDSIISQIAVQFMEQEYQASGVDINEMQKDYLLSTGLKMLLLSLLMLAAAVVCGLLSARTAASIGMDLRGSVFKKVVSFSHTEMDKFSTASLITRSTNDVQQIQMVCVMMLRMVAYAPILAIGGIVKVVTTHTGMGWIIVVAVAAVMILVGTLMVVAMPKFRSMQKLVDQLNLISREILTGIPVIRAFSREKFEEKRFDKANKDLMGTQLFTNRVMTMMMPLMMLIMNGVSLMIVWFGGKGIDLGNMQVGDMIAFITYTMQIIMSFLMIAMISVMLPRAGVAADRIEEVVNTEASIHDPEQPKAEDKNDFKGEVEFHDVSFCYDGAEEDALEHISFKAEPGKTTAIIGSTGCGKTTLINLIPRFYDVTGGSITIDGIDIRDMTQHKVRSLLGYVPQKGILFSGDIESNLKFAGDHITEEGMKEAAEIAQATEFIDAKPDGYKSAISQGGTNVSGGQKQRLSIARALAGKPKIAIFDDSFSALDYKTDAALRKELGEKLHDATVIIVAQRINTILHADQILVLDEGRIAGMGTHEELMKNCESYQEIARSQLSEKELMGGAI